MAPTSIVSPQNQNTRDRYDSRIHFFWRMGLPLHGSLGIYLSLAYHHPLYVMVTQQQNMSLVRQISLIQ